MGPLHNMGRIISTREGGYHRGRVCSNMSDERTRRATDFIGICVTNYVECGVGQSGKNNRSQSP